MISVRLGCRALLAAALGLVVSLGLGAAPASAAKVRPDFFGMHFAGAGNGTYVSTEVGSLRLWDTGTSWRQIETAPGLPPESWSWSRLDAAVDAATARGDKPLIVLGQTPTFYASRPTEQAQYGLGAASMPSDLAAWSRYVRAVVTRYQTRAEYQVWNEPNVAAYFTGTPAEMATLTRAAYEAANPPNSPHALIVSPSMPLRLRGQQQWFSQFWKQTPGGYHVRNYVDVVGIHTYPQEWLAPEASVPLTQYARSVLSKQDVRKPLWNLEINYGLRGGAPATVIPVGQQAAYASRTLLLNAGLGLGRVYWYSWELKGIANTILTADDNQTLTAAGRAYARTRSWLVGTNVTGCSKAKTGLWTCKATVSRTKGRIFYFKPTGPSIKVAMPQGTTAYQTLTSGVRSSRAGAKVSVGSWPIVVTHRR